MSKPKLTPWFPATMKPVRPGIYQRKLDYLTGYRGKWQFAHWDGRRWSGSFTSVEQCAGKWTDSPESDYRCTKSDPSWRGLATGATHA
jgi:hypothetical protein